MLGCPHCPGVACRDRGGVSATAGGFVEAMLALPYMPDWVLGTMHVPVWLGWLVETVPACPCPGGDSGI